MRVPRHHANFRPKIFQKQPPSDSRPSLCGHVDGLSLAVKNGRKLNFKMRWGNEIGWGKERIRSWNAWTGRDSLFPLFDFATPSHFKIQFYSIFRALQLS